MRISTFLVTIAALLCANISFAQSESKIEKITGTNDQVTNVTDLSHLSETVNIAYQSYLLSATTSRAAAEQAKNDFVKALTAYKAALSNNMESMITSSDAYTVFQQELITVNTWLEKINGKVTEK